MKKIPTSCQKKKKKKAVNAMSFIHLIHSILACTLTISFNHLIHSTLPSVGIDLSNNEPCQTNQHLRNEKKKNENEKDKYNEKPFSPS
jgi:hypothetical protein